MIGNEEHDLKVERYLFPLLKTCSSFVDLVIFKTRFKDTCIIMHKLGFKP